MQESRIAAEMALSYKEKRLASHQNVCIFGQHFEESCFVVRPGKRGHLQKNVSRRESPKRQKLLDTEPTIPVPSSSKVAKNYWYRTLILNR